jgi:hypothetical protein
MTPEAVYAQKFRAYQRLETGCHYPNREEWFQDLQRDKRLPWKKFFDVPPEFTHRQQELYGLVRYSMSSDTGGDEVRADDEAVEVKSSSADAALSGVDAEVVNHSPCIQEGVVAMSGDTRGDQIRADDEAV